MDPIELALQDLKLMDPPDISAAARNRRCNRSTLSRRWNKKTGIKEDADINKRLLTPGQERMLINYINKLTLYGLPPIHVIM